MECESEGNFIYDFASRLATTSQNPLADSSSGECQTVARDDISPEIASSSSQNTLSGCT